MHSIWFDTGSSSPTYGAPVSDLVLPPGTSIELAFRGANAIDGGSPGQPFYIGSDANGLDPYGDPIADPNTGSPAFFNGSRAWTADLSALDGARYFQLRISFIGNPVTNATSLLEGLGFSWAE